jgi:hypothetical protein
MGNWELVMPKFSNVLVTKMRAIKKMATGSPALRPPAGGGGRQGDSKIVEFANRNVE